MIDPQLIRNDLDNVARQLLKRGFMLDTEQLIALEAQRKT
ncbi:hypothetical protein MNBD_GAMMA17-39, partial [hydrothermal vent metagenome]